MYTYLKLQYLMIQEELFHMILYNHFKRQLIQKKYIFTGTHKVCLTGYDVQYRIFFGFEKQRLTIPVT